MAKQANKIIEPKSKFNWRLLLVIVGIALISIGICLLFLMNNNENDQKKKEKPLVKQIFTNFKNNRFESGVELKLLSELNLCDTTLVHDELGACSPKYFRFFKLIENESLNEGFILLVNGILFPEVGVKFPIRRILIYEREAGKLVAVNQFKGNLIETRTRKGSPYKDILIRFRIDEYGEKYHVLYRWKNKRYQLERCEEMVYWDTESNKFVGGRVKESIRDSVSIEVGKILMEEGLVR